MSKTEAEKVKFLDLVESSLNSLTEFLVARYPDIPQPDAEIILEYAQSVYEHCIEFTEIPWANVSEENE